MFDLSGITLEPERLKAALGNPSAGACATFEGWVRNHDEGKQVTGLDYQVYQELAMSEGRRVVAEALERFQVLDAGCVHRHGQLQVGDLAVWIGVVSTHRDEAFDACRFIIDEIKVRLPIWKKEHYASSPSEWVNCQHVERHTHLGAT